MPADTHHPDSDKKQVRLMCERAHDATRRAPLLLFRRSQEKSETPAVHTNTQLQNKINQHAQIFARYTLLARTTQRTRPLKNCLQHPPARHPSRPTD
mmetsp:Transcript_6697/g.21591  ORF Transcript_6697/g.21591 Transcript_6697/m.21591 type:complete len:97 (-) Transcript_6697:104-394(-)